VNRLVLVTVVSTSLAVGVVGSVVTRPGSDGPAPPATAEAAPPPGPQSMRASTVLRAKPKPKPRCTAQAAAFDPVSISVVGVIRRAAVISPPRDANGIPGTPTLNNAGKNVFAWDREQGVRPGDARGNVLLNTHTWPQGRALGNKLLDGLHHHGRIVVHGTGRSLLCYRVTKRVVVPADQPYWDYYARNGRPQIAIVVCSGPRLGPRNWLNRTVWFASPSV
jgi:hypothetical protein